jgi:hypothetical protein
MFGAFYLLSVILGSMSGHQGPYEEIQPGATLTWETVWFLRKLPAGMKEQAGNEALTRYVQKIVK